MTGAFERELTELIRRIVREELAVLRPQAPEELVSIGRAAVICGCSTRTIARRIARGDLAAIGEGRATQIRVADLEGSLGERRHADGTPEELADVADAVALRVVRGGQR